VAAEEQQSGGVGGSVAAAMAVGVGGYYSFKLSNF
jgi:hypothetical protein